MVGGHGHIPVQVVRVIQGSHLRTWRCAVDGVRARRSEPRRHNDGAPQSEVQ